MQLLNQHRQKKKYSVNMNKPAGRFMEKISICLASAGRAGEVHGDTCHLSVPNSQIVAVLDTGFASAKAMIESGE